MSWTKLKNCSKIFSMFLFSLLSNDTFAQLDTIVLNLDELALSDTTIIVHYDLSKKLIDSTKGKSLKIPLQLVTKDSSAVYAVTLFRTPNTILSKLSKGIILGYPEDKPISDWQLYRFISTSNPYNKRKDYLTIDFINLHKQLESHKRIAVHYYIND